MKTVVNGEDEGASPPTVDKTTQLNNRFSVRLAGLSLIVLSIRESVTRALTPKPPGPAKSFSMTSED